MPELETVAASLSIEMNVTCPNEECGSFINLLNEVDTNGYDHDDCGELAKQMFPRNGSHDDFECDSVVCSQCKTEFNVKGLEW